LTPREWAAAAVLCLLASFLFAYTLEGVRPRTFNLAASKARCDLLLEDYPINYARPFYCNESECCQFLALDGEAREGENCLSIGCVDR